MIVITRSTAREETFSKCGQVPRTLLSVITVCSAVSRPFTLTDSMLLKHVVLPPNRPLLLFYVHFYSISLIRLLFYSLQERLLFQHNALCKSCVSHEVDQDASQVT